LNLENWIRWISQKENKAQREMGDKLRNIGSFAMIKVGIFLGLLGGVMAVFESSVFVVITNGWYSLIGLGFAILILAGAVIAYRGHALYGGLIMFFSSLIGQLIEGAIGLALAVIASPPPPPLFNLSFTVSSWTIFGLVGSILILLAFWKNRG
jgi:hypothetical protein